ncbi:SDR family oxidoreductase [Diaminobutyricibacter sp. McL0618]|uniref:SDR family oxidoreductase n=1 Tax=Leifsonia sp. McL0618 TaxID=3415677 RepID=UPI003CF1BB0E
MTEIAGTIAIVTGGASGIGRGIAEQLIAEGATVTIADIDGDRAHTVAAEIGATGVALDVTNASHVQALADSVVAIHGKIDIVVNNAGVGPDGRIADLTLDDWRWIMDVNFFGVVNGIHAFLPALRSNPHGGHIVNTASMAVFLPLEGLGPYVASKLGVLGMSEVLAMELASEGSQVEVTVLAPGPVRTNIRESLKHRPAGQVGNLADVDLEASEAASGLRWIDPREAGRIVTRAIRNNDFLAITHPEWWPMVAEHESATEAAFAKYPPGLPG